MLLGCWGMLAENMVHRGRPYAIALSDPSQALATLTVLQDGGAVQHKRLAADVLTVETSAPHAGAHPFNDQAALEFGDGADNHDDGPAQRSGGIDVLPE